MMSQKTYTVAAARRRQDEPPGGGSEAGTWAGRVGDVAARTHRDRSLLALLMRSRRAARTPPRDESVLPIHARGTGPSLRADGNQPVVT